MRMMYQPFRFKVGSLEVIGTMYRGDRSRASRRIIFRSTEGAELFDSGEMPSLELAVQKCDRWVDDEFVRQITSSSEAPVTNPYASCCP